MRTFLFFISIVLLIIFFGDLIFKGSNSSTKEGERYNINSSMVHSPNERNKNALYVSNLYLGGPISINQIDSLTALENIKFTKPNAQKLIIKM